MGEDLGDAHRDHGEAEIEGVEVVIEHKRMLDFLE
jgi:hypothetical protein